MDYKVVIMEEAEKDLDRYVKYLLLEKKNEQAARSLLDDFEATIIRLYHGAESLKQCENPRLKRLGYRRINFLSHRYFILYRVEAGTIFVDSIFHELQDYESHMI